MTARIGYQNLLESGTVVASSENAGYPVENAYDWRTFDYFRPAAGGTISIDLTLSVAASADYFAFYGQDLSSLSGTIKLQYWNGSSYVDCFSAVSPIDNAPVMKFFTPQSSDKWRVVIVCASVFNIACIAFGTAMVMQQRAYLNWTPPALGRDTQLINSVSDGGAFLGRSIISKGIRTTLELQFTQEAWVRTNWLAFVRHAEQKPFFFAHNVETYPAEIAFLWVEDAIPPARNTHYGYMGASVPVKGLVE